MVMAPTLMLLLAVANLLITVRLVRSTAYLGRQKMWRGLLIWLLPVLGLACVAYMLGEGGGHSIRRKPLHRPR